MEKFDVDENRLYIYFLISFYIMCYHLILFIIVWPYQITTENVKLCHDHTVFQRFLNRKLQFLNIVIIIYTLASYTLFYIFCKSVFIYKQNWDVCQQKMLRLVYGHIPIYTICHDIHISPTYNQYTHIYHIYIYTIHTYHIYI